MRGSDGGYKCVVVEFVTCNDASYHQLISRMDKQYWRNLDHCVGHLGYLVSVGKDLYAMR
jgi:hypothetical protein